MNMILLSMIITHLCNFHLKVNFLFYHNFVISSIIINLFINNISISLSKQCYFRYLTRNKFVCYFCLHQFTLSNTIILCNFIIFFLRKHSTNQNTQNYHQFHLVIFSSGYCFFECLKILI